MISLQKASKQTVDKHCAEGAVKHEEGKVAFVFNVSMMFCEVLDAWKEVLVTAIPES